MALGLHGTLSRATSGGGGAPRLYYGGARAGDGGGPKVKVKKLAQAFPEHPWRYNLVYVLSNAPYLTPAALESLKRRRIPIVANQNGVFYPAWYDGDWEAENRRMARQYHLADHVFHQSEFCRRAAEKFLGERDGPSEVLYNAVDTERFRPAAEPSEGALTFLAAGKVQAHQAYRLETTIAGLAAARKQGLEATLAIAGTVAPEASAGARARAESLGVQDSVSFLGPYSQESAPALFASHGAYVNTNHNDACPSTVIEAMAAGLPVLHADTGGPPELVGPDAGVGLKTGESWDEPLLPSPDAVADGMMAIAEKRDAMAQTARARAVERFDIRPWLERHAQVFQWLLDARHA